jgi:hypothetical protein
MAIVQLCMVHGARERAAVCFVQGRVFVQVFVLCHLGPCGWQFRMMPMDTL